MATQMDRIEERVDVLEEHEREQYAVDREQSEQIKSLFQSVKTLRNVVYGFCFIAFMAIIYIALGRENYEHFMKTMPRVSPISYAIPANDGGLWKWQISGCKICKI